MEAAEAFIQHFEEWVSGQPSIEAAALVGSWARGTARPDSDVDVVIITAAPETYLGDDEWLTVFGDARDVRLEDWGLVQSRRVFYAHGLEVEFGITTPVWMSTSLIDPGTAQVIRDGVQVLFDKHGALQVFVDMVNG